MAKFCSQSNLNNFSDFSTTTLIISADMQHVCLFAKPLQYSPYYRTRCFLQLKFSPFIVSSTVILFPARLRPSGIESFHLTLHIFSSSRELQSEKGAQGRRCKWRKAGISIYLMGSNHTTVQSNRRT